MNISRLLDETFLNEKELLTLQMRFRQSNHGQRVMSLDEFLQHCYNPGETPQSRFFPSRLFHIFSMDSKTRGITDGLDFEAYAKMVSTFCPNAPTDEKMFVCFKVFDLDNQDLITVANLTTCLTQVFVDCCLDISPMLIQHAVKRAFLTARNPITALPPLLPGTTSSGWSSPRSPNAFLPHPLSLQDFKIAFIRSRGLFDGMMIDTWRLADSVSTKHKFVAFFMRKLLFHRVGSSEADLEHFDRNTQPFQPQSPTSVTMVSPAPPFRNKTLGQMFQSSLVMSSAPVSPADSRSNSRSNSPHRDRHTISDPSTNQLLAQAAERVLQIRNQTAKVDIDSAVSSTSQFESGRRHRHRSLSPSRAGEGHKHRSRRKARNPGDQLVTDNSSTTANRDLNAYMPPSASDFQLPQPMQPNSRKGSSTSSPAQSNPTSPGASPAQSPIHSPRGVLATTEERLAQDELTHLEGKSKGRKTRRHDNKKNIITPTSPKAKAAPLVIWQEN